jgi:hypothetical protein
MNGSIDPVQSFPVLIDQVRWIQFGIDHDRVEGGMAQKRLDHMHWSIVVEVFRGQDPATIMGL